VEHRTTGCDMDYAATGREGYSIPGKRGEVLKDEIAHEIVSELRLIREELQNVLRIRLICATLKGISHREVLNAASREANGIKTLQRTRDSSQKQFVASTDRLVPFLSADFK